MRDSFTALDYADQRYYASSYGNFTSPDPSMDNVDFGNPASWNAYAYTMGDPINGNDPSGLVTCGNLNVTVGGTVSSFFNTSSNAGLLTEFDWAEGGTLSANGSQGAMAAAQLVIAQAMENRLAIANGQVAVQGADGNIYWGNGGTFNGELPPLLCGWQRSPGHHYHLLYVAPRPPWTRWQQPAYSNIVRYTARNGRILACRRS